MRFLFLCLIRFNKNFPNFNSIPFTSSNLIFIIDCSCKNIIVLGSSKNQFLPKNFRSAKNIIYDKIFIYSYIIPVFISIFLISEFQFLKLLLQLEHKLAFLFSLLLKENQGFLKTNLV